MIVPLLFLAVAAGAALQSATGFGFSLLSAPILFAVVDPQPAIGLLALLGMEVNLLTLLTEGRRPRPLTREATILVSCALPGALLGALDTVAFEARCESAWWPALRARYPLQLDGTRLDDLLVHLLHHRTRTSSWILDEYPSHLHIDLLPQITAVTGHGSAVVSVAFSPDGHTLVTGSDEDTALLWKVPDLPLDDTSQAAQWVCSAAGPPITRSEWDQYFPGLRYTPPCA